MLRLERLAVQLTEAARYLEAGTEPYLRLALELADGACEIQMFQECRRRLDLWPVYHVSERRPGRARLREIDRDFNTKTTFLEAEDRLDPVHGRVLRRLHVYRNESHHQDKLRPATLESAVRILLYLAAQMIEDYRPWATRVVATEEAPVLASLSTNARLDGPDDPIEHRERLARLIRLHSGLSTMSDLAETLAGHSRERWDRVVDALDYVAEYLRDEEDPSADRVHALVFVMSLGGDDAPDVGLSRSQRKDLQTFGSEHIAAITSGSDTISAASTPLAAFHAFADFEDTLEPLETASRWLAGWVDGYYQHLSDVARGK